MAENQPKLFANKVLTTHPKGTQGGSDEVLRKKDKFYWTVLECIDYKSCQKPRVEKNHTLFRDIVPKGESFDALTQEKVNLIFSHINSVKRKIYNGKTPYELFSFMYGEKVAKMLGADYIHATDVVQSPKLLKNCFNITV